MRIPLTVLSGFLGAGKTTLLNALLRTKPADERWVVIVNEFGEIGLDQHFIAQEVDAALGVHVRQIAGGCVCCSSGLSLQITLHAMLARYKPHRIWIEPTGLAHLDVLVKQLEDETNKAVFQLMPVCVLLDGRMLLDARFSTNDLFIKQLQAADVLLLNKVEQYSTAEYLTITEILAQKLIEYRQYSQRTLWVREKYSADYTFAEYLHYLSGYPQSPHRQDQKSAENKNEIINRSEHRFSYAKAAASPQQLLPSVQWRRVREDDVAQYRDFHMRVYEGFFAYSWQGDASTVIQLAQLLKGLKTIHYIRCKMVVNISDNQHVRLNASAYDIHYAVHQGKLPQSIIELICTTEQPVSVLLTLPHATT